MRNLFKALLGIVFLVLGIGSSLYLGLWVCMVGGVADMVNGIAGDPVNGTMVGIGVLKFFVGNPASWLLGFGIIEGGNKVLDKMD